MNTLEFYVPSSRIWQRLTWLVFFPFFKLFSPDSCDPGLLDLCPSFLAHLAPCYPGSLSLLLWLTSPLATRLRVCLLCRPAEGTPPSILDPPCPHSIQMPSGLTCHPVSLPSLQREGGKEGGWQGGREEGLAAGEEAVLGEVVRQELLRADLGLIPALKKRCPINAFPATQRVSLIEPGTPHY